MIETQRLILRHWVPADKDPFYKINADKRVMEFYPNVLTREESDGIIDRAQALLGNNELAMMAVELKENSKFVGFIGLQNIPFEAEFTPAVEIGWRIAFEHWNQGLATEGANAVLEYGFSNLNLAEIISITFEGNLRSRRVMEKIGMIRDLQGDFSHPRLPVDDRLRPHVLYRSSNKNTITKYQR